MNFRGKRFRGKMERSRAQAAVWRHPAAPHKVPVRFENEVVFVRESCKIEIKSAIKHEKYICKQGGHRMEEKEIWVPVKGYEGIYEVSSAGRIRSIDRLDRRGCFRKGVELRLVYDKDPVDVDEFDGNWYARLSKDGQTRSRNFGRIYYEAFQRRLPLQKPVEK